MLAIRRRRRSRSVHSVSFSFILFSFDCSTDCSNNTYVPFQSIRFVPFNWAGWLGGLGDQNDVTTTIMDSMHTRTEIRASDLISFRCVLAFTPEEKTRKNKVQSNREQCACIISRQSCNEREPEETKIKMKTNRFHPIWRLESLNKRNPIRLLDAVVSLSISLFTPVHTTTNFVRKLFFCPYLRECISPFRQMGFLIEN